MDGTRCGSPRHLVIATPLSPTLLGNR
ncbi:hypothetical protein EVAR_99469_1, partial [Eumeta japonica]